MNCSIVIVQKLKLEVIVIIVMIIIQGKNYNLEKQNCCKKNIVRLVCILGNETERRTKQMIKVIFIQCNSDQKTVGWCLFLPFLFWDFMLTGNVC